MRDSAETSDDSMQEDCTPPKSQFEAEVPLDTFKSSFLADVAEDPEVYGAAQALVRLKQEDSCLRSSHPLWNGRRKSLGRN